ncbi:MAG: DMT family transporter [Pseudomonadota bacterium]
MAQNDTLQRLQSQPNAFGRGGSSHWLLLVSAGFAWGSTFSLAKIATQGDIHPLALNFWQTLFGCGALLVYAAVRRRRLQTSQQHIRFYLIAGILGTVIPGVLYFIAARELPAGILAITIATVPMLTLVISRALGSERFSLARLLGLSLGAAGILLILVPDTSLPEPAAAPFVVLAVFCALCYAIENVYIDFYMPTGEALTILCGMLAMASLVTAPITIALGVFWWPQWPLGAVEWSILGMALINAFAYGTFVHLVGTAGPVFASQTAYVVTLSGVAWGIWLFGESHSPWVVASAACMLIGLALVQPRAPRD